jgi:glyoxylase-like metal-dependent hydrolase (beta-lactamase superfamily II)
VPMPNSPLRYTSVYALIGDVAVTLIDTGWDSDESWSALVDGLTAAGASIHDVAGVLVTHMHRDHVGLARRVREATGAWIGMHRADHDALADPDFRIPARARLAELDWLQRLGADPDEARRLSSGELLYEYRAQTALPDRLIEHDEVLNLPGWTLRAIHTPGHTPGHLCFVEETTGLVFSGDHVLPRISPNISGSRQPDIDLLGSYLESLAVIGSVPAEEVLPAHEWRFRGLGLRAAEIAEHHERRLAELMAAVRRLPASTPWRLAAELTWSRSWDQYDGRLRTQAVGETLAHLSHLVALGLLERSGDEVWLFSPRA